MNNCDSSKQLPTRRRLHHVPPPSVSQYTVDAEYFVTFCVNRAHYGIAPCDSGRMGPLKDEATAVAVLDSIDFRRSIGEWFPSFALVMPDHVHVIPSFAGHIQMDRSVGNWKRFLAKQYGICWQEGFFEHRLRNEAERMEKWQYIEMNPVTKGLCANPDEWPFRRLW